LFHATEVKIMSAQNRSQTLDISRRRLLSRGAFLAAGAAVLGAAATTVRPAMAASKLPQRTVNYQPTPRGRASCANCAQWQQPNACKLVDGQISPTGWCSVYAPKA
jgi:hypothetical protein